MQRHGLLWIIYANVWSNWTFSKWILLLLLLFVLIIAHRLLTVAKPVAIPTAGVTLLDLGHAAPQTRRTPPSRMSDNEHAAGMASSSGDISS